MNMCFLWTLITFEPKQILKFCFKILKEERLLFNIIPGFLITIFSTYISSSILDKD